MVACRNPRGQAERRTTRNESRPDEPRHRLGLVAFLSRTAGALKPRSIIWLLILRGDNFRFSADRSFKDKFERLAEVMGVENAQRHMAEILEQALDIALEKKDPRRKLERRKVRQKATRAKPRPDEVSQDVAPGVPRVKDEPARSRYIPSEAIERVHARGNHQCEYKSADGRRCRSRTGLQVEHQRPFAIFRSHDERFLRLLCPPHNRLAAEHVYGAEFIQQKIDKRRKTDETQPRREVPAPRSPLPGAP